MITGALEDRVTADEIQDLVRLAYRADTGRRVLNQLNKINPTTNGEDYRASELVDILQINPGKLYRHLDELEEDNLIEINERRLPSKLKKGMKPKPANAYQISESTADYSFALPILTDGKLHKYGTSEDESALQNRISPKEVQLIKRLTETISSAGHSIYILNYISEIPDGANARNASEVYTNTDIPLATIYRKLKALVKQGFVKVTDRILRVTYYEMEPLEREDDFKYILSSILNLISPTIQNRKLATLNVDLTK